MTTPEGKLDTALLRTAFASAPIGVTISRDGVTEFCNAAYLDMFGYTDHEEEIYGRSLLTMIAPEEQDVIFERIQRRQREDPTETSYDTVGLRRDGTTFPFHVEARRLVLGDGPATLAFFLDLSDRLRTEEELRDTNEKLDALVRCCPVPIVLLDPGGCVQVWNPAAEVVFGWTEAEALGRRMPIVGEDMHDEFQRNLRSAMGSGIRGVEAKRVRRDGAPLELELWAAPVRGPKGDAVGVMALTVDITARKRTERALGQSQAQLRHAQKMEAVGRLAGGVAHDFNNLLTAISGFAALLENQVVGNQDAMATVGEIQRAVSSAAGLTRQLLAFGRQQELRPVVLDVTEAVAGMERLLSHLVAPGVEFQLDLDDVDGLLADASQIEQVVVNLVVNASDAIKESGRVSVRTRNVELEEPLGGPGHLVPPGRYVALEVSDTGTGMDEAVLARLFEPFFTTKERGKGTGLGLSMVYGIVTQSGGFMHVDSSLGEGSTFRAFFPRARVEAPATRDAPVGATPDKAGVVLVVDDDPMVLRLTVEMLRHEGFEVLSGDSAAAALSLLEEAASRVQVLLTDVLMPGVTGPELAERAWTVAPDLPVIFMSGYADPSSFPSHVRNRASDFVAKPFQLDALIAAVEGALLGTRARVGT